jgi:PAS domain S-box-containing protein
MRSVGTDRQEYVQKVDPRQNRFHGEVKMDEFGRTQDHPHMAHSRNRAAQSSATGLKTAVPIVHHGPDLIEKFLQKIEPLLPDRVKLWALSLVSFRNRILVSALLIFAGVVITIAAILGIAIFPRLSQDHDVIQHLKFIHLFASLIVIAIGWLFIDRISRKIAEPLKELTEKADQISRDSSSIADDHIIDKAEASNVDLRQTPIEFDVSGGDEIHQLTTSFNRMLMNLKASESRLIESEKRYRFLFDNGPTPLFVIDRETMKILDVNARAEEEYGFVRGEFLLMNFDDLAPETDREPTRSLLRNLDLSEIAPLPILRRRRKSGSVFVVNFNVAAGNYENRPVLMIAAWDATEKLEKQAKLIHAGKMATLGEMATGIAHELNQPLYVIRIGVDFLSKKLRTTGDISTEEFFKVAQEINDGVSRATGIINHLREFGRKTDETTGLLDINEPIRKSASLLRSQLETHKIEFALELQDELPPIRGNSNRLEQVFMNLIVNARDAILSKRQGDEERGRLVTGDRVIVRSGIEEDRVTATISDTGPGIPKSLRSKIFEPFFTTKQSGHGTGLGLAISYSIVKDHNGSIEILETQRPGSVFKVTFPKTSQGQKI